MDTPGHLPTGDTSNQSRFDDGHDDIRAGMLRFIGFGFCTLIAVTCCSLAVTASEVVGRVVCLLVGGAAALGAVALVVGFVRRRFRRRSRAS